MRVAVMMSAYNGEKYIREQIESIFAQKGDFSLDLWIRDDGSSDNTHAILKEYLDEKRMHWYVGKNIKPAQSFIDLIKHCVGYDYYAFADQDDYWMTDKIDKAIAMICAAKDPTLYFSNAVLVDAELNSLDRNVYNRTPRTDFYTLCCAGGFLGCTMVFNNALAKIIQDNETPQTVMMHDFFVAMLCSSIGGKIIYDPAPTMKYRQHGNNVVGVPHGIVGTLMSRINALTRKEQVSISEQAGEIIKIYGDIIPKEKIGWLMKINMYKNSFKSKACLACSCQTKYINFNMGLKIRLSILFGNR